MVDWTAWVLCQAQKCKHYHSCKKLQNHMHKSHTSLFFVGWFLLTRRSNECFDIVRSWEESRITRHSTSTSSRGIDYMHEYTYMVKEETDTVTQQRTIYIKKNVEEQSLTDAICCITLPSAGSMSGIRQASSHLVQLNAQTCHLQTPTSWVLDQACCLPPCGLTHYNTILCPAPFPSC